MSRKNEIGYVYFIQDEDEIGLIKIGKADNVEHRLKSLQVGCPMKLKVLAAVSGGAKLEAKLHQKFQHCRERGEWFNPVPELKRLIGLVITGNRVEALTNSLEAPESPLKPLKTDSAVEARPPKSKGFWVWTETDREFRGVWNEGRS